MNNTDRVHTNMYHFISKELIYRYATFKHLHWFKENIQKTFEIVLEHMSKHSQYGIDYKFIYAFCLYLECLVYLSLIFQHW